MTLYCDGACSSSGTRAYHGGWSSILLYGSAEFIVRGHYYPMKSGQAELQALIAGLGHLQERCTVSFYSDSQYLVNGVNLWLAGWIRKGWPNKIVNREQWQEIDALSKMHTINGNWIRGHADKDRRSSHQEYNTRCDEMAVEEAWKCYRIRRDDEAIAIGSPS